MKQTLCTAATLAMLIALLCSALWAMIFGIALIVRWMTKKTGD